MCDVIRAAEPAETDLYRGPAQAKLSALIDHLLSQTSSFDDESARSHRRVAVWGPVNLGIRLEGASKMKALSRGWAVDLSADGMGLLTPHELPRGELMFANLEPIAGDDLELAIRVIYCQQLMPATYRVGVYFDWDV
jgi:hypothetical protein